MKKRIFIVGIIFILISMLVILTGCGNNEKNNQEQIATNNQENNEEKQTITVNAYYIADNYAVVEGSNEKYYIINKDGKVEGELEGVAVVSIDLMQINQVKNTLNEGYFEANTIRENKEDSSGQHAIFDITGKRIFRDTDNISYYGVSSAKSIIAKEKIEELSGTTITYKIQDFEGNTLLDNQEKGEIHYIGDGFYWVEDEETKDYLYNAKEKQRVDLQWQTDEEDFDSMFFEGELFTDKTDEIIVGRGNTYVVNKNGTIRSLEICSRVLSNENKLVYYLGDRYGEENKCGIYDFNGNMLKDLSEGKVKDIWYENGKIFVLSETGFYYVLDENYNYLVEPVKAEINDVESENMVVKSVEEVTSNNVRKYKVTVCDMNLQNEKVFTINNTGITAFGDKYVCSSFEPIMELETGNNLQIEI